MKKNINKLMMMIVMIMVLSVTSYAKTDTKTTYSSQDIIKKLCLEFDGRQSGTQKFKEAANFVGNEFSKVGMIPLFKEDTFLQEYETTKATLKNEEVIINGKKLIILKDYKPYSRCDSGNIDSNELVFIKDGLRKDYDNIDVKGKVVAFYEMDNNKRVNGVTDRVLLANKMGASCALIINNNPYASISQYELPLNGRNANIPAIYVSSSIANQLGLSMSSDYKTIKAPISIKMDIDREETKSYNVVGVVEGKRTNKAVLIVTNLDGQGKLPDGRFFQSAGYGALGTTALIDLATYYKNNTPEYTVILASVGGKYTDRKGITELLDNMDFYNVISTMELYTLGNNKTLFVGSTNKYYEKEVEKLGLKLFQNNQFGSVPLMVAIKNYTDKMLFVRDAGNDIKDLLNKDTYSNVSMSNYTQNLKSIKSLLKNIMNKETIDEKNDKYKYIASVKEVYNDEVKRSYLSAKTKYFDILLDKKFKSKITTSNLKKFDNIYETVKKFNYYSMPLLQDERITLVISEDLHSSAILTHTPKFLKVGKTGGFASQFNNVVALRVFDFSTFSHELNHLMVDNKKEYNNVSNRFSGEFEECQGHTVIVAYSKDGMSLINSINTVTSGRFVEGVSPIVKDYKSNKFNWNWADMNENNNNPYGHFSTYNTLASMLNFIYYNYGENAFKRAVFRIYDTKDIVGSLTKDISLTEKQFLSEWYKWITLHGKSKPANTNKYNDSMNQFDYYKIFGKQNKLSKDISNDKAFDCFENIPMIQTNQKTFVSLKDDANSYKLIQDLSNNNKPVKCISIAQDEENFYIKIKYNYDKRSSIAIFLAGTQDQSGILYNNHNITKDNDTLIAKFSKEQCKTFDRDLVFNMGYNDKGQNTDLIVPCTIFKD